MRDMAAPAAAPKQSAPERTSYGLERRHDNMWAIVTYRLKGDSVVARTDSDPDAFQSQLNRLTAIMRRLV